MMNCEFSVYLLVLFIVLFGGNGYGLRTVKGEAEAGPSPAAKPLPESSVLSSRTVHTKYGDLRGVIWELDGRHLGSVEVFRGVPYASPPVGNLRFMPPVTGALWRGVKMADRFSPVCPQRLPNISDEQSALKKMPKGRLEYLKRLLPYLQNQSEDCLYLNIYTPTQAGSREAATNGKYPVMVYIHGESFEWNSGNPYDGSVLASYGGVVVVTINYRLGILGFLNANSDRYLRSPANYGLMDQIAALHWVQENIAVFGGDPTNVTIVGHGTGAACINLLMTSSAIPDGMLFQRAILMSGSSLSPWALVPEPSRFARHVAKYVNCSSDLTDTHLLKCLRERPLESLLAVPSPPIHTTENGGTTPGGGDFASSAFGPSVDGVVIDAPPPLNNAWVGVQRGPTLSGSSSNSGDSNSNNGGGGGSGSSTSTNTEEILRKKYIDKLGRYDLLFGVVRAEAYFAFAAEDIQYGIESERRGKLLRAFVRDTYRYHQNEILATVVNEYTDWERPVQHPINIRDETMEALGDAQVVAPLVQTGDFHSAARPSNSFFYVFDYQTKFGDFPQRQGCVHGEELPYVFGAPLVGGLAHFPRNYTKAELQLAEAVIIYWSNFARTGNPNEPVEPEAPTMHAGRAERNRFKNIEWPAYEAVHKKYLSLDTKPKLKNHYRAHRLSFWLNLVPDLHRPGGPDVPASHHQLDSQEETDPMRVRLPPLPNPLWPEPVAPIPGTAAPGTNLGHHGSFNLTAAVLGRVTPDPILLGINTRHNDSQHPATSSEQTDDGFAAYSTALSVTIAIGCSLLILNVLIFAGVYYQRDKHRIEIKKRNENGQMPNISGDLELSASSGSSSIKQQPPDPGGGMGITSMSVVMSQHQQHQQQTQLPPPEFADILPPPPPAVMSAQPPIVAPHHYHPAHHHHHGVPKPPPPPKSCGPPLDSMPSVIVSSSGGTLQRQRQPGGGSTLESQARLQHQQQQQQLQQQHDKNHGNNGAGNTATLKKSNLHGKVSQLANNIEELRV